MLVASRLDLRFGVAIDDVLDAVAEGTGAAVASIAGRVAPEALLLVLEVRDDAVLFLLAQTAGGAGR